MGDSTSVSIGFNTKEAQQEIRALGNAMKQTQNEFKITDTTLKTTGSSLDRLKNKYQSLSTQMEKQAEITKKCEQFIEHYAKAQENSKKKLEESTAAYKKGKVELKGNKEEIQKLKDKMDSDSESLKRNTRLHDQWVTKLSNSKLAEANLRNELKQTSEEMKKQSSYIAQVQEKYKQMNEKTSGLQKGLTTAGKTLTATVTAPIIAAGVAASKAYIGLNEKLANIGTLSVDGERLKELKSGIQEIAADTAKNTDDIADGVYQVISAFGDTNDTLAITEINAKAARAGLATTTDSINLTSAVTKGYGDTTAAAVEHVADLAFKTVELGQTTFPELAASMGKVIPQSQALGVSQEELFTVFATLTGVTGKAAEVSTQLGAIYTGLMTPSTELQELLKSLGYESGFAMVKSLGFSGALDTLTKATGGSEEKLTQLFGSKEAITAMLALTGAQADTFSEKLEKMGKTAGTTEKAFKTQSEGVNKAGFAFEQATVKMQTAAQNFGESAAPYIDKAADAVNGLADWLNELDDEDCSRLIKVGIGLAALGPAMTITSKGIKAANGGIAVFSKIGALFGKTATAAVEAGTATAAAGEAAAAGASTAGAATKGIVSAISAIPLPAKLAVASVAAIGVAGKVAYDTWYNSQYRWSKGLSEGNKKISESLNQYKKITDIQGQIKSLKLIIENPDSSAEQVQNAKSRLEEIKQLLSEEYNLVINSDNSNLDDTVEKVRQISKNELQSSINQQRSKLASLKIKDVDYENNLADATKEYNKYLEVQTKVSTAKEKITDLNTQVTEGELSTADAYSKAKDIYKDVMGTDYRPTDQGLDNLNGLLSAVASKYGVVTEEVGKYNDKIQNLNGSHKELQAVSEELANWETELIKIAAANGDNEGVTNALKDMSSFIKTGELDMSGYAQAAALAMNGIDNLETAWEQAANGDGTALDGIINGYIQSMQEFGASAEETATGAALIQNGFRTIDEAVSAGKLNVIVEQANELAHSMGLIPEDKHIVINADGDITVLDTAKEGIENIDGSKAEAKVTIDADGGEQTVMSLQELIDTFGASQAVALLQADDQATVTINGVSYRLIDYDSETGIATLQADDSDAAMTINTATGEVQGFDNVEGTAKLKANSEPAMNTLQNAISRINNSWSKGFTAPLKTRLETGSAFPGLTGGFAAGTDNAPEGPAVINDEKGIADPREIVKHKGKYYLFEGRNVVVNLSKGDSVYTAAQTKKMLAKLPHYATGTNNEAFNSAKDDFEYRQKTSVVTDAEALLWWKNILEEYASDADVVKEANIEIYELTNKINDDAIKDYKDRIKKQESASKDWIDYEVKMHNLSIDEQIAAYGRMDENYLNTLTEMTENTTMTAEELEEVWGEYYDTLRDHEMKVADLRKKNLEDLNKQSLDYIDERTYYNDWEQNNDTPEAAYERIKERNMQELLAGHITDKEYNESMTEAGQKLYEGRLANSKKWLEMQYKYGAITEEEYRAGLKRVKEYTEEYYRQGIISGQYYYEAMDDANGDLFDNMSASLKAYVDEYYEAQKEMLTARRAEIEAEYEALESAEKKADRAKELKDLQAQYTKYQNAVTIEGKKKLQEIQDNIDSLKKEEAEEIREAEKQTRLDEIDKESEELEKEQENTLNGISKYTAQALGIISGGNDEMISKFNKVVENYNQQQAQLAQSGYDTVSKIVDMTNSKLAELGQNLQPQSSGGDVKVTVTQTFNNNINDEVSAMAYGKHASSLAKDLGWVNEIVRNGGFK